jgi:DNA-binding transcriptional ArsR family regulator
MPARHRSGLAVKATLFAALGDETRLSLIGKLSGGQRCSISDLTQGTKLTRQAVTKHLRVLERARIVHPKRAGRESLFELDPQPIHDLSAYLETVSKQWDGALARLKTLVENA